MDYDIIGGETQYEDIGKQVFTVGDLINLAQINPLRVFKFLGTDYTVGYLHSWRGVYALPAISYEHGEKVGIEIATQLEFALNESHSGWKGGEYRYTRDDEFYVSREGDNSEYKVVGYEREGDTIVLLTKLIPW